MFKNLEHIDILLHPKDTEMNIHDIECWLRANEHITRDLWRRLTPIDPAAAAVRYEAGEAMMLMVMPGITEDMHREQYMFGPLNVQAVIVHAEDPEDQHTLYGIRVRLLPDFVNLVEDLGMAEALARYSFPDLCE